MDKIIPLLITFLSLFISCTSEKEEVTTGETILGFWKGKEFFSGTSNGMADWDLYISKDSVFELNYPTELYYGTSVNINSDSITWTHNNLSSKFSWEIEDSLLILVGKINNNIKNRTDSIVFVKRDIQTKILNDLKNNGYNSKYLADNLWILDKKGYESKNPNSSIYAPKEILNFNGQPHFQIGLNKFLYEEDTFEIVSFFTYDVVQFDNTVLLLNHVVGLDTLIMMYSNKN
ncbi:hypothetical protein K6119_10800 [Paracrocinitomix mangrovi]|uniref:hypothetical protein n=1 Tax=Paracrocinitomix mangrovi TaxID=2862509 RepID=UPI001C8D27BA|nr:hypothetical protein [Paracrocinitomix mangrovi]UKN00221.1 hypothetical protein K6119_10800 [Paracrocinitomix mangrovi]